MKRDDQLAFSAVAVTACGLLAVVTIMVMEIMKGMGDMKCKFTYECSECGNPCQISGDHVGAPGRCPYNVAKADWREVAAMPKLTAEKPDETRFVLDGVEYEAIEVKGEAGFDNSCRLCEAIKRCGAVPVACGTHIRRNDGKEVYWRKVKKDEKPQLPDWLKVGEWVYDDFFGVGKIVNPQFNDDTAVVDWAWSGDRSGVLHKNLKPVTFREFDLANIVPLLPLTVRSKLSDKNYHIVIFAASENCVWLGSHCTGISYTELIKEFEQLNGLPCGVPQVEGKDLEK